MTSSSSIVDAMLSIDQAALNDSNPNPKTMKLFRYGQNLTEREVEPYEKLLAEQKKVDAPLGILLLGYYYSQRNGGMGTDCSPGLLSRFADLLEWFIENHPGSFVLWKATYPHDDDNFARLKNTWCRQCSEPSTSAAVLNNAAHFCAWAGGDDLAEVFWKRAKAIHPSAIWSYELACLYKKQLNCAASPIRRRELAEKALLEFADMQARPNDYPEPSYLTPTLLEDTLKQFRQLACEFDLEIPLSSVE